MKELELQSLIESVTALKLQIIQIEIELNKLKRKYGKNKNRDC
jgi:hypothetical protein